MAWLDLTRTIVDGMPVYPGDPLFQARAFADHEIDGFRGTEITLGTHLGTHVDVPFHYFIDGETLDSYSVDFFFGEAAILDFSSLVGIDSPRFAARRTGRPAAITCEDLAPFEPIFESTPFVFFKTGWSSRFGESDYYTDFPSLSPDVCEWLADYPKLRLIGLETPSLASFPQLDDGENSKLDDKRANPFNAEFAELLPPPNVERKKLPRKFRSTSEEEQTPLEELELHADSECHRILLGRQPAILIVEGLTNLDALPCYSRQDAREGRLSIDVGKTLEVACLPLPIAGLDGCPVRVAAQIKRPTFKVVG